MDEEQLNSEKENPEKPEQPKKSELSEKSDEIKAIISNLKPILDDKEISPQRIVEVLNAFLSISFVSQSIYRAPLPPPDMLAEYNKATPDGAERIMKMVEKQATHRIDMEGNTIGSQNKQSERGQIFGLAIGIMALIATVWLGVTGHDIVAGVVGGTTIVGLVTVFVLGRKGQEKNLSQKEPD